MRWRAAIQCMGIRHYRHNKFFAPLRRKARRGKAWSRSFWIAKRQRQGIGNAEAASDIQLALAPWHMMRGGASRSASTAGRSSAPLLSGRPEAADVLVVDVALWRSAVAVQRIAADLEAFRRRADSVCPRLMQETVSTRRSNSCLVIGLRSFLPRIVNGEAWNQSSNGNIEKTRPVRKARRSSRGSSASRSLAHRRLMSFRGVFRRGASDFLRA